MGSPVVGAARPSSVPAVTRREQRGGPQVPRDDGEGFYGVTRIPLGVLVRAAKAQPRPYIGSMVILGFVALTWMVAQDASAAAWRR